MNKMQIDKQPQIQMIWPKGIIIEIILLNL